MTLDKEREELDAMLNGAFEKTFKAGCIYGCLLSLLIWLGILLLMAALVMG